VATANLASMGGPADQKVFDGIVQEIDIRTGKVLFQWDGAAHVPYRDSHSPLPGGAATPWDWFHINAVHLDTDGNLLISSRYTWTTYKVSLRTGHAQTTPGGNLFVGWGALPWISEFSPSGRLLYSARLPAGVSTYRAYLLPWPPAG
jgi:hypothetical protein